LAAFAQKQSNRLGLEIRKRIQIQTETQAQLPICGRIGICFGAAIHQIDQLSNANVSKSQMDR